MFKYNAPSTYITKMGRDIEVGTVFHGTFAHHTGVFVRGPYQMIMLTSPTLITWSTGVNEMVVENYRELKNPTIVEGA